MFLGLPVCQSVAVADVAIPNRVVTFPETAWQSDGDEEGNAGGSSPGGKPAAVTRDGGSLEIMAGAVTLGLLGLLGAAFLFARGRSGALVASFSCEGTEET